MARPPTHHESRKAAIVEAALDCFARHGYDGATNKLIAEAAGMKSAALIYHYFPSKEILSSVPGACQRVRMQPREHLGGRARMIPDVFLRQVGRTYPGLMREDSAWPNSP